MGSRVRVPSAPLRREEEQYGKLRFPTALFSFLDAEHLFLRGTLISCACVWWRARLAKRLSPTLEAFARVFGGVLA